MIKLLKYKKPILIGLGVGIVLYGLILLLIPHQKKIPIDNQSNITNLDQGTPDENWTLADPCPPGVPAVYKRPDGSYVVRIDDGAGKKWTTLATELTPAEFCTSFQGNTTN